MATGTRAAAQRSYEDFEPATEWKREPSADTLLVHLPGFRKEQMKVQVTSARQLRIVGERPLGNNNKWSRFKKEIPIGSNYDTNEINARFDKGILYVKHPKVIAQQPQPQPAANNQQLPSQKPAAPAVEAPKPIPPPPPAAAAAPQLVKPPSWRAQDQKPMAAAVPPPAPASAPPPKEASIWKVPPTEPSASRPPRAETKNPETGMGAKPDKFSEQEKKEKHDKTATNGQLQAAKADEMKKAEGGGSSSSSRGRIPSPLMASEKYKEAISGIGMRVMEIRENPKSLLNLVFAVLAGIVILLYLKNAAKSVFKFKGADIDEL
ncbi:unnamed protein product [Linum tenue]|uniref:SHSP domain-containing protein n=1 Tax=Linum tenue TaxID=586396 RepID=A0AAV0N1F1_9ROSI|nr:unnamed protein product [Linum tenue]